MNKTPILLVLLTNFLSFSSLLAQSGFKHGDTVEVSNIGKGIIVGEYRTTEWGYGTYPVHLDGEKYCNNHVLDTRYSEKHILPLKKREPSSQVDQVLKKTLEELPPPSPGNFKAGDSVLYSETSLWNKGIIKSYDPSNRRYTLQDVYVGIPCYAVAKPAKSYNNDFFIGQWQVHISGANYTTVEKGKVFDNVSGGMKLYTLNIKADGSYTWKVSRSKILTGRWKPREDAPGIVILKGIDGTDWTVYETTEAFATTKATKDEIRFHDRATHSGYYLATRIGPNKSCVLAGRSF